MVVSDLNQEKQLGIDRDNSELENKNKILKFLNIIPPHTRTSSEALNLEV